MLQYVRRYVQNHKSNKYKDNIIPVLKISDLKIGQLVMEHIFW